MWLRTTNGVEVSGEDNEHDDQEGIDRGGKKKKKRLGRGKK